MTEGCDCQTAPGTTESDSTLEGAAAESWPGIVRARKLPRVSWLAAEARLIEAITLASVMLVGVAFILPIWLLLGPPAHQAAPVNRFLEACQVGVERGILGAPGYLAAIVLFAWGAFGVVRLVLVCVRTTFQFTRSARAHVSAGQQAELLVERRAVRFSLLPNREPMAFTAGILRPRIYLSSGIFRSLSLAEQNAVIVHEATHARRRDPMRCLAVEVVFRALALPASHRWSARYRALQEVTADVSAISASGDSRPLLRALTKVVPVSPPGACCLTEVELSGIVALRAATLGVRRSEALGALAGFIGLLVLVAVAIIGLTDWQSFFFCPLTGGNL